jgi:hypothetical protein
MLSDAAARRLALYCDRAAAGPAEFVERKFPGGTRAVRYVPKQLRSIVWADTEVRNALLNAEHPAQLTSDGHGLNVLDLMSAMSLESELREAPAQHPS